MSLIPDGMVKRLARSSNLCFRKKEKNSLHSGKSSIVCKKCPRWTKTNMPKPVERIIPLCVHWIFSSDSVSINDISARKIGGVLCFALSPRLKVRLNGTSCAG